MRWIPRIRRTDDASTSLPRGLSPSAALLLAAIVTVSADATVAPSPSRIEIDYSGGERLTMNMGPQHPSAHGVFRAILTLEGENVVGVDAVIGYLHPCPQN